MSVLPRLREATAAAHKSLEDALDLIEQVATPAGRRRIVSRFHGLHLGAEAALEPALAGLEAAGVTNRRRSPWLAADLLALGADPRATRPCPVPAPSSAAEALGFLYVLEGSTLGGKMIRKALEARGADMTGLGFLNPYGEAAGERFRALVVVLEDHAARSEANAAAMVRGAVRGFAVTQDWLCRQGAPA